MTSAYDFDFMSIDGKPLPLSKFKGHPVLVVNVASKCGLTPQYEGRGRKKKSRPSAA